MHTKAQYVRTYHSNRTDLQEVNGTPIARELQEIVYCLAPPNAREGGESFSKL